MSALEIRPRRSPEVHRPFWPSAPRLPETIHHQHTIVCLHSRTLPPLAVRFAASLPGKFSRTAHMQRSLLPQHRRNANAPQASEHPPLRDKTKLHKVAQNTPSNHRYTLKLGEQGDHGERPAAVGRRRNLQRGANGEQGSISSF